MKRKQVKRWLAAALALDDGRMLNRMENLLQKRRRARRARTHNSEAAETSGEMTDELGHQGEVRLV